MDDFIFGSLATEEKRLDRILTFRSGVTHNFQREPLKPLPDQSVTIRLSVGPSYPCDQAFVYWTADGSDPIGGFGIAGNGIAAPMSLEKTEWDTLLWGYVSHFSVTLPGFADKTMVRYRIGAMVRDRGEIFADEEKVYAFYVHRNLPPSWATDAIVYQIFSERFFPGDGKRWRKPSKLTGFYGGTLKGITAKMDYLSDLGVNTLWLTPIFPSPSHHGYDALDLFDIEPRLGTKDDLKDLIDQAHTRNIRILLDFVPNHISFQHPIFRDAATNPNSRYKKWFTFKHWPDVYVTFFGVKSLPQINLRNAEARRYVLDAARYWLEFGVDGYRVDYALGPTPDFWAEFFRTTRAVKPDCWIFGEIVDPPDVQLAFIGGLDGALDFMLLEALRQAIAFGRWDAVRLSIFLDRHEAFFPVTFSRPSFLDNHDMNRFLWAAGNDKRKLRLGAVCQFTLAGAPVVYYGTEVGLTQERDVLQNGRGVIEESRLPMIWGSHQDTELLAFYKTLISIRKQYQVLRSGRRVTILAQDQVLVYAREDSRSKVVTAMNFGDSTAKTVLQGDYVPLLITDEDCTVIPSAGETIVQLSGLGAAILNFIG